MSFASGDGSVQLDVDSRQYESVAGEFKVLRGSSQQELRVDGISMGMYDVSFFVYDHEFTATSLNDGESTCSKISFLQEVLPSVPRSATP